MIKKCHVSKNIFTDENSIQGVLRFNGNIDSSTSNRVTDYIKVPNDAITITQDYTPHTDVMKNNALCFYTEDKTYISGSTYASKVPATFNVPANAIYFRASYRNTMSDIMINEGATALPYEAPGNTWNEVGYKKYGTETDTITALPATIIGDGTALSAWEIKGNMSQTGTPTSASPIYPSETGERTINIFPKPAAATTETNNGVTVSVTADGIITVTGRASEQTDFSIPLSADFLIPTSMGGGGNGCFYMWNSAVADTGIRFYNNGTYVDGWSCSAVNRVSSTYVGMANKTVDEIQIRVDANRSYNLTIKPMFTNNGEIATVFEPYGFVIPIVCGNTTTPYYLSAPIRKIGTYGDTASNTVTRVIKKLVLTGQENISAATQLEVGYRFTLLVPTGKLFTAQSLSVCSHFVYNTNWTKLGFCFGQGYNQIYIMTDISGVNDTTTFANWLAIQYQNGTPVTIWYVLSTAETETVTAPNIPTIDGEQVFDVSTTLKPSAASVTYHGWHEHEPKEYSGGSWA